MVPGADLFHVDDQLVVVGDFCLRRSINQRPGLFECYDRPLNFGVVPTGVGVCQPNFVEKALAMSVAKQFRRSVTSN